MHLMAYLPKTAVFLVIYTSSSILLLYGHIIFPAYFLSPNNWFSLNLTYVSILNSLLLFYLLLKNDIIRYPTLFLHTAKYIIVDPKVIISLFFMLVTKLDCINIFLWPHKVHKNWYKTCFFSNLQNKWNWTWNLYIFHFMKNSNTKS